MHLRGYALRNSFLGLSSKRKGCELLRSGGPGCGEDQCVLGVGA
jgi:hypothetical protein